MVEVGAHADVGVEQVVLAVLVGHPALVEEHVRVGEPELVGEPARVSQAMRISGTSGLGCLMPEEEQPHVRDTLARSLSTARISVSGSNQL